MAGTSVLFFAPLARTFHELSGSLARTSWLRSYREDGAHHWRGAGMDVRLHLETDPRAAAIRANHAYYPLAIVDCRHLPGTPTDDAEVQERALHEFLERLRKVRDPDLRFPFERVAVLVGGDDYARTDRLLFDAGAHHVGLVLRDQSLSPGLEPSVIDRTRGAFLHDLWDLAQTLLSGRKLGRKALCAAGGGITGIHYELGVLKCLQDAFGGFDVRDFDMFFGISAGAVVTTMLANQLSIDDCIDRVGVKRGGDLAIQIELKHLNWRDIPMRIGSTVNHVRNYIGRVIAGEEPFSATNLAWQFAAMIGPVFSADDVERRFARFLSEPGFTNDFRELSRRLYIGTTDQDLREHVLFGDSDQMDVPISKAVQASAAIHPFFRSVEIKGRRYTDGFVTRTSNLAGAIERGANFVIVIDPFLPMIADEPGENAHHGALWGVLQDYKTVAYTRFQRVTAEILRQNPHVTSFSFVPSNRMRRLMARNPMASSDFDAIVVEAYRSTYRRLLNIETKAAPRLQEHGIDLDLARVARTIDRLDRAPRTRARILLESDQPPGPRQLPTAATDADFVELIA